MKPIRAWALAYKGNILRSISGRPYICPTRKQARSLKLPSERVIPVEIREVPQKKGKGKA